MKESILIVDDDSDFRKSLARCLASDYTIYTAANGQDAIGILKDHVEIRVILSDMQMPEMSGLEMLEQISTKNKKLSIIFISGSSTVQTAVDAMRKGAFDYLTKPVDYDSLVHSISKAFINVTDY